MQWVAELFPARTTTAPGALHVLEVGSLSPSNAISKAPLFNVTRIDLNSQHPSIATQDFMERPLPASDAEKFDLISLSLVLNYVPDAGARGDMLVRTTQFLRSVVEVEGAEKLVPGLFLVLPAPCVTNSRYLHEKRLAEIMGSLGYALVKSKLSPKLVYGLWVLKARNPGEMRKKWKKDEVNPGLTRNNFAITMK